MTEEEYFRKTYPDYCYGDRLLSPYWDFFQDGVEFGERQSEKKIEKLEKKIRCECTRCVYSDSPCIRSDYGVENDEDVCPNYKNVFVAYTQLKEENAELKKKLEYWKSEYEKLFNEQ